MEDTLGEASDNQKDRSEVVLILILMEDTLGEQK